MFELKKQGKEVPNSMQGLMELISSNPGDIPKHKRKLLRMLVS
jgi:hypothetical protein